MLPAIRRMRFCLAQSLVISGLLLCVASAQISSTPSSLTYSSTYVGMESGTKAISIKNNGTTTTTLTAITSNCPEFKLASGYTPYTLPPGKATSFSMFFQPAAVQTYNCDYTITQQSGNPLQIPLNGTGLASGATVSVSATSLSFPNQPQGTPSAAQTITVTNSGTASVQLETITIEPPSFSYSAGSLPITINAGSSAKISVGYSPEFAVSEVGVISFGFSSVPTIDVDLTGNGTAATKLELLNIPLLPTATEKSAYEVQLLAASGVPPYTFSLKPGSTLPSGLTLSSSGLISGTLASTVTTGNYTFTAGVKDNDKTNVTKLFTLTVAKTTGSICNNIWFDVPKTTTPMVPITDLGTGTYQGEEGGLYPNGSNVRPPSHDADGVALAQGIVPLDSNGNYSPTGKYALLALGESTALDAFGEFLNIARTDPALNSALVFVNGAQGGATPHLLASMSSPYWNTIINNYLPDQGVDANQVVAIWMEDSNGIAKGTFPGDMSGMQTDYETVMNNVHTLFPNLKLFYFSSRIYAGYSNGVATINPEPYAYEAGFAQKNAIGDQLNGDTNLNYNPLLGPVKAPWMSFGPYYWANGLLARSDGLVWTCQDLQSDGTHPSFPAGDLKVAGHVLNFFKTDDTTTPWFLHP